MATLSIITVNLNNKSGLCKTAESVIAQTSRDFEWIVVDGESTDGSIEYLTGLRDYIDCLIAEKDHGIYDAMNKGVRKASGDYLLFMNSGDVLNDDKVIEDFLKMDFDSDVVYGDSEQVKSDGTSIGRFYPPAKISLLHFFGRNLNHQAIFFSRGCFDRHLYNLKYRLCADYELLLRLMLENKTFEYWLRTVARCEVEGISYQNQALRESEMRDARLSVLPHAILSDYEDFVTFRDVDLAIMTKRIIKSKRSVRQIARVMLYPIYHLISFLKW